jgi:toxin-antitoxin system PIN domain toxin
VTYLLDANVLIALVVEEHEHHDVVSRWAAQAGPLAVCPIVEGALLRFILRVGEMAATGAAVLTAVRALPSVEFWPDIVSYADLDLSGLRGHREVTDLYLVGLATANGATLATLDEGLAHRHPTASLLLRGRPGE